MTACIFFGLSQSAIFTYVYVAFLDLGGTLVDTTDACGNDTDVCLLMLQGGQ